jgi:hypothetical protein
MIQSGFRGWYQQSFLACDLSGLRERGLIVKRTSPLAITVEGDSETFEKTFQAKLDETNGTVSWNGSPTIPDKLSDVIADVVFPQAVKLS